MTKKENNIIKSILIPVCSFIAIGIISGIVYIAVVAYQQPTINAEIRKELKSKASKDGYINIMTALKSLSEAVEKVDEKVENHKDFHLNKKRSN